MPRWCSNNAQRPRLTRQRSSHATPRWSRSTQRRLSSLRCRGCMRLRPVACRFVESVFSIYNVFSVDNACAWCIECVLLECVLCRGCMGTRGRPHAAMCGGCVLGTSCMYVYTHRHTHVCMYHTYIRIYTRTRTHTHRSMYTNTHTHTHTHTHRTRTSCYGCAQSFATRRISRMSGELKAEGSSRRMRRRRKRGLRRRHKMLKSQLLVALYTKHT